MTRPLYHATRDASFFFSLPPVHWSARPFARHARPTRPAEAKPRAVPNAPRSTRGNLPLCIYGCYLLCKQITQPGVGKQAAFVIGGMRPMTMRHISDCVLRALFRLYLASLCVPVAVLSASCSSSPKETDTRLESS